MEIQPQRTWEILRGKMIDKIEVKRKVKDEELVEEKIKSK